jgi:membrane dipeptidase
VRRRSVPSMQPVFDGHNDTITRRDAGDFVAGRSGGHIDLPRARAGGLAGGIFAIFTSSEGEEVVRRRVEGGYDTELAAPVSHEVAAAHATAAAGRLLALERAGAVRLVRTAADLDAALADGVLGAVLHLEGAEAIDPGLEALDLWHAAGLRSLGPVWSRPNAFAHGVPFAHPSSPDTGPGLTDAGKALVRRCGELGIVVDCSHLNAEGFWDVAALSPNPMVASHSGCHAVTPSSRNLTDQQLDAIGISDGIVGIVFGTLFLREDGDEDADTPLEAIVAHVRHAVDRIGVTHVGLGSDFDGTTIPAELGDAAGLPRLLDALRAGGFSDEDVERIAWGNWRRVLERTWGS